MFPCFRARICIPGHLRADGLMEKPTRVLAYAVRGRVVAKYGGQLMLMLALLATAPLVAALVEDNSALALRYVLLCAGLMLVGVPLARLPAPERIQTNEALTITFLVFLGSAVLMSWPMAEAGVPYIDALFEAVSGVTTTGLSTLGTVEGRSDAFMFARSWMQWYGGLGFVILSVALLMGHRTASRRLLGSVQSEESLALTVRTHAQRTLAVYAGLTLAGLLVLWPLTSDGFTALLHVLSSVSTGGFSTHDASLAGLQSRPAAVAVMLISLLGAFPLYLYWESAHAGWRRCVPTFFGDPELQALLLACMIAASALVLLAWLNDMPSPWYDRVMIGISAQTTTGFSTTTVADLDAASKVLMTVSMLTGGGVGSSAGGFKILRLLILIRLLQLLLRRTAMPLHAVAEARLSGQTLEADGASRALQLILLFVLIVIASWVPFVASGYDPLDALFEVVSATGTVGLSTGISSPGLEAPLKMILCLNMLAGRVEIVALLVVLYPGTWFGRREKTS